MEINFIKQIKQYGKVILFLILVLNFILLATWWISFAYSIAVESLLEDPASQFGYNQFIGFTTYMGVLVLAAGIGSVMLLLAVRPSFPEKKGYAAIIGLALITLFLILDDLFLLHERVFTGWLHVRERSIFAIYLLSFSVFMLFFRKQLFGQNAIFLLIAVSLFGISLATDLLSDKVALSAGMTSSLKMIEESCKLGGYLFWTGFIFTKSKNYILPEKKESPQ